MAVAGRGQRGQRDSHREEKGQRARGNAVAAARAVEDGQTRGQGVRQGVRRVCQGRDGRAVRGMDGQSVQGAGRVHDRFEERRVPDRFVQVSARIPNIF